MIRAIFGAFAQITAKPQVLVAGIIAAIVQFIILFFSLEPLENLAENVFFLGNVPNVSLIELPLQFYRMYFIEINILLLAFVISLAVQLWLAIVIARFAANLHSKKEGIFEAIGFGIKNFGKIIGTILFLFAVAGIIFVVFQFLVWISYFSTELSIILMFLLSLLAVYVFIKLVFFVPIIGCKEASLRQALEEAWNFGAKRFWKILILLIIITIISGIIDLFGTLISDLIVQELASSAVLALFSVIASTYSALVLANYYLNHESSVGVKFYFEGRHRRKKQ